MIMCSQGHRVPGSDALSDMCEELSMLRSENASLRLRVAALQEAIRAINARVTRMAGQEAARVLQRAGKKYFYFLLFIFLS